MRQLTYSDYRQNGFDTRKRADGSFYIFKKKYKTKTILSPTAPSAKPCDLGMSWEQASLIVLERINNIRNTHPVYYNALLIMYYSGCRVSEVCKLRYCDFINKHTVVINASKSSENRIVTVPDLILNLSNDTKYLEFTVFNLNRYQIYRFCISLRLHLLCNGVFEDKPTKLFRFLYASMIYEQTKSLSLVARTLGHKNEENSKFYIYNYSYGNKKKV
jgi:integrase